MLTERRFRGTLTSEYDLFDLACPKGRILDAKMAKAINRLRPRRPTKVLEGLELGFGTGLTTRIILGARPDLRLTAIDNERQMLPKARKNLKEWIAGGRLSLKVVDALPFLKKQPPRSCDFVATAATLHNFSVEYRTAVLKELARVIKPGGLFVNADKYAQSGEAQRKAVKARMDRYFQVAVPRGAFDWLKSVVIHYMGDESPERRMDEKGQVKIMRAAGFARIKRVYRMDMTAVIIAYR